MLGARPVRLSFLPPEKRFRLINSKSVEDLALALHEHIFAQPQERFANQPWELVKAIETFAQNKRMMIFKQNKLTLARQQLHGLQPPPKTIIEFGTYVGNSAIAWGAILRDLHGGNVHDCNVYTFELSSVSARVARDLVRLAGLEDLVRVLEGPAAESLKKLHIEGKVKPRAVDMAFFDHWEKFYLPDLQLCEDLNLFHRGSLVIADNTDFPGAPDYLAYVKAGGRGGKGTVRYDSQSLKAVAEEGHPSDAARFQALKSLPQQDDCPNPIHNVHQIPSPTYRSRLTNFKHRTVFSLIIINKAGGLIYQREFQPGLRKLSTNDYLVLAGTFHGVHAITRSITPKIPVSAPLPATPASSSSNVALSSPSGTSTPTPAASAYSLPNPGVPVTGLESLETDKFRLTCFQTLTGTKFLLFTDPLMANIDAVMKKIYELYSDYVMKNPFYQLEMPVRCEAFDRHLGGWLRGRT
ncbi:hypothetical protein Asppvi_008102 [Aspergillus pseudoviridinutans]|uniref:Sybindin-domain-containing protein n=1 Tax=Aspergillus pseudoviridinutans TaxID=1517512 RepID=A0A9P3BDE5_9EURO|nr:uncharacterized protein Asppvi_008102 [Aspergillus pseudoviridinutans]GIJ89172.1 hypothetical protein Asppvi_008102 [Aspergillus pseudoviridinutans]